MTHRVLLLGALLVVVACNARKSTHAQMPSAAPVICDFPAQAVRTVTPEWPESARSGHVHEAQVTIHVELTATGRLVRATLAQSSGFRALDDAALIAAMQSPYEPAVKHCKRVAGSYDFKVTFSSNWPVNSAQPLPFSLH